MFRQVASKGVVPLAARHVAVWMRNVPSRKLEHRRFVPSTEYKGGNLEIADAE